MSDSLIDMLAAQKEWSTQAFGPGFRGGVIDHIKKEIKEVEEAPYDIEEWIDLVILAFDGAWRAGATPEEIVAVLQGKYKKNRERSWPDWRTLPKDKAIEHHR